MLGIPLLWEGSNRTDNTPSLDRIVPHKGYVPDNVCVISWRANRLKSDASPAELRMLADYAEKHEDHEEEGPDLAPEPALHVEATPRNEARNNRPEGP